jgi:hypothetical protein
MGTHVFVLIKPDSIKILVPSGFRKYRHPLAKAPSTDQFVEKIVVEYDVFADAAAFDILHKIAIEYPERPTELSLILRMIFSKRFF